MRIVAVCRSALERDGAPAEAAIRAGGRREPKQIERDLRVRDGKPGAFVEDAALDRGLIGGLNTQDDQERAPA